MNLDYIYLYLTFKCRVIIYPEQRRGKFLPKQKVKMQKDVHVANEPVSGSQSDQPESNYTEKDSVPTFQQDDMLDLSDLGLNNTLPTEVTQEIPLDKESVDHMETAQTDSGIHLDVVPEIPVKLVSLLCPTVVLNWYHVQWGQ